MQTLSTSRPGAQSAERLRSGPDRDVWLAAGAFIATASLLMAGEASLGATLGLATAASAGSALIALARAAERFPAPLFADRLLQGGLCATLLWAAQLLAAGALPAGIGLFATAPAVLALFLTLSAVEAAAAGLACLSARRGMSGCIATAILIDNRAFASLGALHR
ncbi:MAG: hypothetical protein JJ920_18260 [Roseitalea sp.]|jgi:hypothetical protein|nr:hypothetical protein [Roseitalea sp.]MBO6721824.1 hypothetical protein [Roseitalea sp.]MBO6744862.1 hypothetical protein [Roseitalea sp.]